MVVHLSLNFVTEMVSDCISDTLTFNFFPGGGGGGGGGVDLVSLGMYCPPPPSVDFPRIATGLEPTYMYVGSRFCCLFSSVVV